MIPARKRLWKRIILGVWLVVLAAMSIALLKSGISASELPGLLRDRIQEFGAWGPLAYIVVFTVRPITIFPSFLFIVAAGLVWGPFWGIVYTLVGENSGAAFAFWVAPSRSCAWTPSRRR